MPKQSTLSIQRSLVELGQRLGFDAKMEVHLNHPSSSNLSAQTYTPLYDVVWFYSPQQLNAMLLDKLSRLVGDTIERLHIPFAVFEIEGSTTSSKNQIGNLVNLYRTTAPLKCMVTINGEASRENDTYRRGHKIVRSLGHQFGQRNLIFVDAEQLTPTLSQVYGTTHFDVSESMIADKRGHGGEKSTTREVLRKILSPFEGELIIVQDGKLPHKCTRLLGSDLYKASLLSHHRSSLYQQESSLCAALGLMARQLPSDEDLVSTRSTPLYIPKIDAELGFYVSGGIIDWLQDLKRILGDEQGQYCILDGLHHQRDRELFLSLVGIEYESQDNKHALGGLANLSMTSQLGLMIAPKSVEPKLNFIRESLGFSQLYFTSCHEG